MLHVLMAVNKRAIGGSKDVAVVFLLSNEGWHQMVQTMCALSFSQGKSESSRCLKR